MPRKVHAVCCTKRGPISRFEVPTNKASGLCCSGKLFMTAAAAANRPCPFVMALCTDPPPPHPSKTLQQMRASEKRTNCALICLQTFHHEWLILSMSGPAP
ncbi:hypothetical protein MPTK1_6g17440 [Marchantia polymorpha subsp. ruderalis]|uniref:Uncharacterized protein n=2 Tax=Marchantia polymorpha TaxID=3197 RepID=A0AAF6BT15_MARPO|nr:hypothetical protein MARPO_0184s0006 [Marchantia polymorpha]BBN15149.1 hypothetical protein Mp_6g17440 [Marchantia polymorpha subsp. ruderalis]|eukprot:PTQ27763.1 hypothetical protein MARPO_0184s0006 [Marchantia polymorpha]